MYIVTSYEAIVLILLLFYKLLFFFNLIYNLAYLLEMYICILILYSMVHDCRNKNWIELNWIESLLLNIEYAGVYVNENT